MLTKKQATDALIADLKRSGIAFTPAMKSLFQLVEAETVAEMFPNAGVAWAYKIAYPAKYRQMCAPMYRFKVLEYKPLPFGAVRKDPPKYLQPPNTPPGAYFAATYPWEACLPDASAPLVFVEGEKKALAGCLSGFNVIGLGGVWSWRSKTLGWSLLPELAAINWAGRPGYICFDSDAITNVEVARAIVAFCETLTAIGAVVHVATIPALVKGEKAGLDDFLLVEGRGGFIKHLSDHSDVGELATALWRMNATYATVQDPVVVVNEAAHDDHDQTILRLHRPADFRGVLCSNVIAMESTAGPDGVPKLKKVRVVDKWMDWPARRGYEKLTYAPGEPRLLNSGSRLNTWPGLAIEPKKGDVKPWKQLLDHMFQHSPREHRVWFERWIGYPLKNPGAKMFSAVGLWGKPGRGKSIIAEKTLASIYGRNFVAIAQTDLEGEFNGWAVNKQFVLVDEVSIEDARSRGNRFKKLITQATTKVNVKFLPEYFLPDHVNYFMTSNSPRAFTVEDDDRRFFIHHVPDEQLPEEFFRHYADEWLAFQNAPNYGPGASALLHYFQNELDYGDFNPKAAPPMTQDKEEMIELSRHPADDWLRSFAGSEVFKLKHDREIYRAAELCEMFQSAGPRGSDRISPNGFGAYIASAGLLKKRFDDGGDTVRAVAVANQAKWRAASTAEWRAELHRQTARKY